jgi:WD40 repeat protein
MNGHEQYTDSVLEPDFSRTINTNFTSMLSKSCPSQAESSPSEFCFSKFEQMKKDINGPRSSTNSIETGLENPASPSVWCMDCVDGIIILGCANGRIEIWDTVSGQLKVHTIKSHRHYDSYHVP